jgi:hypothetical protein
MDPLQLLTDLFIYGAIAFGGLFALYAIARVISLAIAKTINEVKQPLNGGTENGEE